MSRTLRTPLARIGEANCHRPGGRFRLALLYYVHTNGRGRNQRLNQSMPFLFPFIRPVLL